MIQNATSINCTPVKPAFRGSDRQSRIERMEEATDLVNSINEKGGVKSIDADTVERIRDYVDRIEVDPNSKVMGPLKTLALSGISLLTGTLLARGTANRVFYLLKDKPIVQNLFGKLGGKMGQVTEGLAKKAANSEGLSKFQKHLYAAANYIGKNVNAFAEKGIQAGDDVAKFASQKGEKFVKKLVQGVGSAFGLTTTGMALSVDKDNNGKSDMLEFKDKKKEQKVVTELAAAVLDAI